MEASNAIKYPPKAQGVCSRRSSRLIEAVRERRSSAVWGGLITPRFAFAAYGGRPLGSIHADGILGRPFQMG